MKAALIALFIAMTTCVSSAENISVSVAVSLKEAVTDAARAFEADTGDHVDFAFGSSGQLVAQIKNGAEVDAFISAANKQVDELTKAGMVDETSRRVVCGNQLALIVPANSTVKLDGFEGLAGADITKIATGEPKTVPAGQYAQEMLKSLKLDQAVAPRLIYGSSVRQVLAYVENGDVTAGIVYATDARQSGDKVKIVARAQADWHEPIVYPGVVLNSSKKSATARRFLDFLGSGKGRAFLAAHGFTSGVSTTQPSATRSSAAQPSAATQPAQ